MLAYVIEVDGLCGCLGGELDLWGRSVLCATTRTLAQQMVALIDEHQFERD